MSRYRCQIWVTVFLAFAQQLCGQTSVVNYAPSIFSRLSGSHDLSFTLWIGVVKFIVTVLVIWKIEHFGRKFLLWTGIAIVGIGQCLVSIAFSLDPAASSTSAMFWALPGVLMVVMGYSMSFGPLTWLLTSEVFPTDIRGRALGVSTILTNLCAAMVTSTFFTAENAVGFTLVFLAYAIVCGFSVVFVIYAIPDTGGKSVEEIDSAMKEMRWWKRTIPKSYGGVGEGRIPTVATDFPDDNGVATDMIPSPKVYDSEFT